MFTFSFEAIEHIRDQVAIFDTLETGGLLAGCCEDVTLALPAGNVSPHPECEFTISPEELADLVGAIEAKSLTLLGTYHSHPNGNTHMSTADAAMARSTGALLIVAPGERWQWRLWDPAAGGEVDFAIAPPRA